MSIQFSPVISTQARGSRGAFSVQVIDLDKFGTMASPVATLDHFRVRGRPFPPHPHAGFSAVTYVLEDSEGGLRSRDSLGNDVTVGPGGIVWTQAGSGLIHQEVPAENDRELHGIQIFVNLSAKNKLAVPRMLQLDSNDVPEWRSHTGDRARVVVGAFEGASSPLMPAEPFNLLDVELRREMSVDLEKEHNALIYVLTGAILVRADGCEQKVADEHAMAIHRSNNGDGGVLLRAERPSHFLILSGAELREPALTRGPFIMNEPSQIEAAFARYQAGKMGHLPPLSDG